jgi:hypothetical protein
MKLANKRVHPAHYSEKSMTYREWLAGVLMQGLISVPNSTMNSIDTAQVAIEFADALIDELEKTA